jgi:O-antigen/teichoic acid export membrane protein
LKKKFVINLLLLIILNLLIKPFWVFGIDRAVQNSVGLSEYGLLFTLFNLSVVFNIFLDFGITNFNNRAISQHPSSVYLYFSNIVIIKFILAIFYSIISIGVALLLGYEGRQLNLLFLLLFNQFLLSFILYLRSNIIGLQYFTTDSILSVIDRFVMIISCLIAYYFYFQHAVITIEWFVLIQTGSYIVSGVVIMFILLAKTGKIPLSFRPLLSWKIIRGSLPFALLIFLMSAYSRIDTIMLERLLPEGSDQAGIYAQSFRILDSAVMMAVLFAGLLLPMFSRMIAKNIDIIPFTTMVLHLILVISVSFSFASFAYSKEIISTLYNQGGIYSAHVFSILILTFIPISVINVFGTLVTASGKLRTLNGIAILSLILNMGLNFILIPRYWAIGAAVSSLITQFFVAISQGIIVRKQFANKFFLVKQLLFFITVIFGYTLLLKSTHINWFYGFVSIGILGIASGFMIGLIPYKEGLTYFKQYIEGSDR